MNIFIGIASYMRPEGLQPTLETIRYLRPPPNAELLVIVANKDPGRSAQNVCETALQDYPFPLHYLKVEQLGVASVGSRLAGLQWSATETSSHLLTTMSFPIRTGSSNC